MPPAEKKPKVEVSPDGNTIKINEEEQFEVPSLTAQITSKAISDIWVQLGRPTDPFSTTGKQMVNLLIKVWEDNYPADAREWKAKRTLYQNNELSTKEQVHKGTGRSLASYPYPLYMMMKKVFKGFKFSDRNNVLKLVRQWPMFRFANKA